MLNIDNSFKIEHINNKKYYYFKCDKCNNDFKVESNNITRRKTNSCLKCSSLVGLVKINIKPKYQGLLTKIKNSARKKEC